MAAAEGLSQAGAAGAGATPGGPEAAVSGLTQFVLIHKHGEVWIKFSCPCGQRLLFPTHQPDRVGRCGRCGREHRMVGLEKRIASFEKHILAQVEIPKPGDANAGDAKSGEDGLLTRLMRPSEYADAAPPELAGAGVPGRSTRPAPVTPPPPDDFEAFYRGLKTPSPDASNARGPAVPAASPAASHLTTAPVVVDAGSAQGSSDVAAEAGHGSADETAEVSPPPSVKRRHAGEAVPGAAGAAARGESADAARNPGETGMLTDFDMAPMEPLNSARVRETADLAADRLRPRASVAAAAQPSGLIWAWPPATPFARSLAAMVDLLAPALGAIVAALVARQTDASVLARLAWVYGVLCGLGMGWDLAGLLWGAPVSPGKRLAGIHVRLEAGTLPGLPTLLKRSAVKWLATPLLWPLAFTDAAGRALHDRAVGTRVLFGRPRES